MIKEKYFKNPNSGEIILKVDYFIGKSLTKTRFFDELGYSKEVVVKSLPGFSQISNRKYHQARRKVRRDLHLCESCAHIYPTCKGKELIFGNGRGNDNVIKCDKYQLKII